MYLDFTNFCLRRDEPLKSQHLLLPAHRFDILCFHDSYADWTVMCSERQMSLRSIFAPPSNLADC